MSLVWNSKVVLVLKLALVVQSKAPYFEFNEFNGKVLINRDNSVTSVGSLTCPSRLYISCICTAVFRFFFFFASLADLIDLWRSFCVSPSWVRSSAWNLSTRPGWWRCFRDLNLNMDATHTHLHTLSDITWHDVRRLQYCHVLGIRDLRKFLNYWSHIFA